MTALDQNFSSLASLLMQRRQMQQEQAQQDRANRLADLQYNRLNREEQYQTGLESAMANPGVNTATSIAPNPQPSLANLMPGSQLQPPQFEQQGPQVGPLASRVQTTTTPRSAAQAGAEYALSKGRVDDAIKMFSVDDAVAQLQAKGDLQGYYKAKQELDQGAKFFEVLKPYKGNPAALKQVWPQIQRMFPRQSEGITPDNIGADANGMFAPMVVNGKEVPNRVVYHDDDGKTHIVDTTPKDSGKPFDRQYDEGDTRVTELYDAQGKLTATKRAPRYKPAAPASDKTDGIVAREVVKDLPKLRREARTAEASKPRLQQMVKLLDSGSAGGIKGNALAAISGIFDTPATSEAELFKKLAAAGAGQLRTSVIGPGAVSNYEQSLLQAISGGGNGARTATRQLLKYYEQEADRTISNYNDAVDSAVTVAPKAAKGFGRIGGAAPAKGKAKNDPLGIL